jgi:hypothetical protein
MAASRENATPPAFVVAIGVMLIAGIALTVLVTYGAMDSDHYRKPGWWHDFLLYGRSLVWMGTSFATTVLMLVGFAELVRRAGPGNDGLVLRAGLIAVGVMLACSLASVYVHYWWMPRGESSRERWDTVQTFSRWQMRVRFAAALVASISLVVAGRRQTLVTWLGVPLIVLTMLQFPTPWISELVYLDQRSKEEMWGQAIIEIWIRLGFCGLFMAVVTPLSSALPPAPSDMVKSGQGLERVGSGLVARVIIIVVTLFALFMTVGAQSPSLARVSGVLFAVCFLIASLAIITGIVQAGGLARAGAPRLRLYTGAALTITAMMMDLLRAIALYLALRRGENDDSVAENLKGTATVLPYLSPLFALAGLWCVLSAAAVLRRMAPEARVDERGINAAAASVTIFTLAALATLRWLESGPRSQGVFIIVMIFVGFANIVAQLAVARVCHRVGAAMRDISALPTAVATVK